jgi:hypothetical protein
VKGNYGKEPADLVETTLQGWQLNVLHERGELAGKVIRLAQFMGSDTFTKLGEAQRNLLHSQLNAMNVYLSILDSRIERFIPEDEQ